MNHLKQSPKIYQVLRIRGRQLEPSPKGLALSYAFTADSIWVNVE